MKPYSSFRSFPVHVLLLALLGGNLSSAAPALAADASSSGSVSARAGSSSSGAGATVPSKRLVLVGKFSGAKSESARAWVAQGFAADSQYQLVPEEQALTIARGASEGEIATRGAEFGADVVVLGRATFKGKMGWLVLLEVYDGPTGKLMEKVEVAEGSFEKLQATLVSGEPFIKVADAAPGWPREKPIELDDEPKPASADAESGVTLDDAEESPEPQPASAPSGRPSPLRLLLGTRIYSRAFRYSDALADLVPASNALSGGVYNLAAAPMPRGELAWYPAAHFTEGWPAHLGLVGGYEMGLGAALLVNGQVMSQSHSLWYMGGRGRIPLGPLTFGLQADLALHTFQTNRPAGTTVSLPDVAYGQIELGADFEWRVEQMIVGGHAGLGIVLATGQVGKDAAWFPGTSASAINVGFHTGWQLSRVFDFLVGVDVRAYGLDFGPIAPSVDPTQRLIAGGATDRYTSFWLGFAVHWPGAPEAVSADASADPDKASSDSADEEDDFGSFD